MNFFLVTDGQTESNAYEPTMHKHRWAKKMHSSRCPRLVCVFVK